jgi:hypothetical protein
MERLFAIVLILLLVILLYFRYSTNIDSKKFIIITKKENLDLGFDPKYDRTFHQSVLDHQSDKMKDQKGYTVDDYLLGDLLYQRHS